MKERPILFSGAMVRAILDGRKTQTRRAINRLRTFGKVTEFQPSDTPGYDWAWRDRGMRWNEVDYARLRQQFCPYGVPGDRLWVRETFKQVTCGGRSSGGQVRRHGFAYQADSSIRWSRSVQVLSDPDRLLETDKHAQYAPRPWKPEFACFTAQPWKPSIHMPRAASRITLEITDVRVQRLQDISEDDSKAEGCEPIELDRDDDCGNGWTEYWYAGGFEVLWSTINGRQSWNANPWVWALTFKRVDP